MLVLRFLQSGLIYRLSALESFAFGSLLSAVDPVVTLAIFQALKVDLQLYMQVALKYSDDEDLSNCLQVGIWRVDAQ